MQPITLTRADNGAKFSILLSRVSRVDHLMDKKTGKAAGSLLFLDDAKVPVQVKEEWTPHVKAWAAAGGMADKAPAVAGAPGLEEDVEDSAEPPQKPGLKAGLPASEA